MKKNVVLVCVAIVAVGAIGYFAINGFPPTGAGAQGTVGAAVRHQSGQITKGDVALDNPDLQTFMQTDVYDKIIKDPQLRNVLSNQAFQQAISNEAVRQALSNDAFRQAMSNDAFRQAVSNDAFKQAMDNEAFRQAVSNDAFRQAVSNDAFRQAMDNEAFRQAMGNEALRQALSNQAFKQAMNNDAFRQAMQNDAFKQAMKNEARQQALFALINRARATSGTAVVASGPLPPLGLALRDDLRSRLGWGLVYQVWPLSDADKARALARQATQRGVNVHDDVIPWLLAHTSRDMRALSALLDALDRFALTRQRAITLPLVREYLKG